MTTLEKAYFLLTQKEKELAAERTRRNDADTIIDALEAEAMTNRKHRGNQTDYAVLEVIREYRDKYPKELQMEVID